MPYYPTRRQLPPCPDPELYTAVQTKEGWYWRRIRGSVNPAALNTAFQDNVAMVRVCSPAAQRLMHALAPYLQGLDPGRLNSRLVSALGKVWKDRYFSYQPFVGMELQREHPLNQLLLSPISITQPHATVVLQVPIKPGLVYRHETLVSDFYLQALLVSGDPLSGKALKTQSVESPLYAYDHLPSATCTLQLPLDAGPWLLLLKFCSLEGNELAIHARHYGMKVVGAG